jgi:3-oxoacyl-[acyl-carrier-protein] synthase-3
MIENGQCCVAIAGTGSYTPSRVLTNAELEKMVDTSDDWITSRTGIKERRIAAPGEATSDMAVRAAEAALENAKVRPEELDIIIVATVTPDTFFPATACYVQSRLGAKRATAFDVSAACSGFLYALQICRNFINTGHCQKVLIIGSEKLSSMTNWEDRNTCVLFGDGAGAAVLVANQDKSMRSRRVLSTVMGSDGDQTDILVVPGGGSKCPITPDNVDQRLNTISMLGRDVYKYAVNAMKHACEEVLSAAGLTANDVAMVIPHQANIRIIEAIVDRLGIPMERTFINLDKYGNTSSASIPLAVDYARSQQLLSPGKVALMTGFGGGMTWASAVVRW